MICPVAGDRALALQARAFRVAFEAIRGFLQFARAAGVDGAAEVSRSEVERRYRVDRRGGRLDRFAVAVDADVPLFFACFGRDVDPAGGGVDVDVEFWRGRRSDGDQVAGGVILFEPLARRIEISVGEVGGK